MRQCLDQKNERISDKFFLQTLITSVISIVVCIIALCSITFAWFTEGVESNSNRLESGCFNLIVSVTQEGTNGEQVTLPAPVQDPNQNGTWVCQLPESGTYTVTLTLTDDSNVKGHCIVSLGDNSTACTAAIIGVRVDNPAGLPLTDPFVFTVTVSEAQTLTLEPHWGISIAPTIEQNGSYPNP